MDEDGFNPAELYPRLLNKVLTFSFNSKSSSDINHLSRDVVVIFFGGQKVRLVNCWSQSEVEKSNFIEVHIEGDYPIGTLNRLLDYVKWVCREYMPMLHHSVYLPLQGQTQEGQGQGQGDGLQEGLVSTASSFLSLSALNAAISNNVAVKNSHAIDIFPAHDIPHYLSMWSPKRGLLGRYDTFASYRWDKNDQAFLIKQCNELSMMTVGESCRGINAFADIERLQKGRQFQEDFVTALIHTKLVMPHITTNALTRLLATNYSKEKVDNLLIEWIIMQQGHRSGQLIYPIAMGDLQLTTGKRLPFYWSQLDQLSDEVPTVTLKKVEELLALNGLELAPDLKSITVKEIVKNLTGFLTESIIGAETLEEDVIEKACRNVKSMLNELEAKITIPISQPTTTTPPPPPPTDDALNRAWTVLHDGNQITDVSGLRIYLDSLGAGEKDDLEDMTREQVQVIVTTYLKPIGGTRFQKAMYKVISD